MNLTVRPDGQYRRHASSHARPIGRWEWLVEGAKWTKRGGNGHRASWASVARMPASAANQFFRPLDFALQSSKCQRNYAVAIGGGNAANGAPSSTHAEWKKWASCEPLEDKKCDFVKERLSHLFDLQDSGSCRKEWPIWDNRRRADTSVSSNWYASGLNRLDGHCPLDYASGMKDLDRALSDIHSIRHQVARGTQFRGYGPASIAFSGVLAIAVAWGQTEWSDWIGHDLMASLIIWISVAAVSLAVSALETFSRARRVHFGMAQEMLESAVEQFLPALVIGVLLTVVLIRFAPDDSWLLPGIWELIFSLGIFASCRFLPRQMFAVGVWYLAAGLGSVIVASSPKVFLPWTMGIPFGVGQLLVAAVLRLCFEDDIDET